MTGKEVGTKRAPLAKVYKEGLRVGKEEGVKKGYETGLRRGLILGKEIGLSEGFRVGARTAELRYSADPKLKSDIASFIRVIETWPVAESKYVLLASHNTDTQIAALLMAPLVRSIVSELKRLGYVSDADTTARTEPAVEGKPV